MKNSTMATRPDGLISAVTASGASIGTSSDTLAAKNIALAGRRIERSQVRLQTEEKAAAPRCLRRC